MAKTVFQSQLEDEEALQGLLDVENLRGIMESLPANESLGEAADRLKAGRTELEAPTPAEAIVMLKGYPSLLIRNGDYEEPENPVWQKRLDPYRDKIQHVIANSGRVDLVNHPDHKWVGSAWRVDEDVFVTNRHVAAIFAEARGSGFDFIRGVQTKIDMAEEHGSDRQLERLVDSILHIEETDSDIDLAVLRVERGALEGMGDPIQLSTTGATDGYIGVVGYPAFDWRNPNDAMLRIFRRIFNVKRLAPGSGMDFDYASNVFTHNATTLGGNSGSVVFDVETGFAVGLHFAGSARTANYAAKAEAVHKILRSRSVSVGDLRRGARDADDTNESEARDEEGLSDRRGYQPDFIGSGPLAVALPQLNPIQKAQVAKTQDGDEVLNYRHFSIVMNGKRRLAFFAAANIDGEALRRPRRVRRFKLDPRLAKELQAGEDLYARNDLDRGHLIRRLDPTWGTKAEADEANRDSMFFTNIAPQHKDLNQRIWLQLEDHVLDTTDDRDARVSVFVGCVFGTADPVQKKKRYSSPYGFLESDRVCGPCAARAQSASGTSSPGFPPLPGPSRG